MRRVSTRERVVSAITLLCFTVTTISPSLAWAAEQRDVEPSARVVDEAKVDDVAAGHGQAEPTSKQGEPEPGLAKERPDDDALQGAVTDKVDKTPAADAQVQSSDTDTLALPTGADKSGVTSQAISVPKGSGTIQGMGESFSAQLSTGIATFSVPFALPAARGGAQPSLGLSYSSASGSGLAGMGWSVGVPFIARQTDRGLPGYDDKADWHANQDRFVFNGGQELVPICRVASASSCLTPGGVEALLPDEEAMPLWATGHQYFRPRVEGSFLRFFWAPNHETWRVQDKSGVTMELGVPLDGRAGDGDHRFGLEVNPSDAKQIYRWHLVRQYDTYGGANPADSVTNPTPFNVVVYKYFQDGGQAYLSDIYDTTPANTPAETDVRTYAHHTRLSYGPRTDPTESYRSGWLMKQTKRLERVDVTSKTLADVAGARRLVRRYHLEYDDAFHTSYLASVQVEGRCGGSEEDDETPAESAESLGATDCAKLPPMTFGYSHVKGFSVAGTSVASGLPGYEAFDARLQQVGGDPPHSVDEEQTDYFDINSDGLPDVLVTAPGVYGNDYGVFFNSAEGVRNTFGAVSQVGVAGVLGANSGSIKLSNPNVAPLDLDADGIIDFLHMPKVKTYSVYTPELRGTKWTLVGRTIDASSKQNPKIDLGQDAAETRVLDVNFDGMVDVVVSTGTEFQTFLSLGRLPGGDAQFGDGKWTSKDTASLSNDPISKCVPYSGTPVRFSDSDIQLADMNGDGIQDIVRLRRGDFRYWPGRGNGYWGTGLLDDCPAGTFGDKRYLTMTDAPYYSDIQGTSLRMDDVNGDGLDDLVQVRFDAVDVWLNVDGKGWTKRAIIDGTPASPSYANRVRLMDINGSGTRDIVWGNGKKYQFMDLAGGVRPGVLTRVENGLGKSTDIEYQSSTEEMLEAERTGVACDASGQPWASAWCSKMPTVTHVVKRVTESDNLSVAGSGFGTYVTEYSYRDPVYEGRQREFRGFRKARSKRVGDANSPTDFTESTFLLGECEDETDDDVEDCAVSERWRDNPKEALKGLPIITERYDEQGVYLSTEATTYRLRHLYLGLDGRLVRHAFESGKRATAYDTDAGTSGGSAQSGDRCTGDDDDNCWPLVELEGAAPAPIADLNGVQCTEWPNQPIAETGQETTSYTVPLRATAGSATTTSRSFVDAFGNRVVAVAHGCVDGDVCPTADSATLPTVVPDESLCSFTEPVRIGGNASGWLYRTKSSWTQGSVDTVVRGKVTTTFNDFGAPTGASALLSGTVPLNRFHAIASRSFAGAPSSAVGDTAALDLGTKAYDSLGNLERETGPDGRCRDIVYDASSFKQLPMSETTYTGGCGVGGLTTIAGYDRGLGLVTYVEDMTAQISRVSYDQFGRLVELRRPRPDGGAVTEVDTPPSVKISYDLPTPENQRRFSIIHSQSQDGRGVDDHDYLESYSYVDGMGRSRVSLSEADPDPAEDGHPWIVSEIAEFDAKGTVRRKYLPFYYDGDAEAFPVANAPDVQYGRQRYDAFGRQVQTYDIDGTVTLQSRYHALSTDLYDAADLYPGPHQGSYASTRTDGHGRAVAVTERVHVNGALESREVRTLYLASGQPLVIARVRLSTGEKVTRWMRYDSLGRMVLNVDPHATVSFNADPATSATGLKTWRYVYNAAGDLVGTSDARGCGQNFHYDSAGRLVGEDYSPCVDGQALYSVPNWTTANGVEVLYQYDSAPPSFPTLIGLPGGWGNGQGQYSPSSPSLRGRLVAVHDRAATTWFKYDPRGRVIETARKIAKYNITVTLPGQRYRARWYYKQVGYDAADRPVRETTGATQLLGTNGESAVTTEYTLRGDIKEVGSSYGDLVKKIDRDAEGKVRETTFGDAGETTTHSTYDSRRRLASVQTYRGLLPPPIWSSDPPAYTPAPTPDAEPPSTFQLLLQDLDYKYDVVNNPVEIRDWRTPDEWPNGAKPVSRRLEYDDLYRVTRVDYQYPGGKDEMVPPFAPEMSGQSDPRRPVVMVGHKVFPTRPLWQTYQFDWLGNTTRTDDDRHAFYDRSLGDIVHEGAGKPYQLTDATQPSSAGPDSGGLSEVTYDAAGNLTRLRVTRTANQCDIPGKCTVNRMAYQWDEVGRLHRAEQIGVRPTFIYLYDYSDQRVLREHLTDATDRHTLYIFDSLEIRGTELSTSNPDEYILDDQKEVAYLLANGMRLGRVVKEPASGDASFKGEPQLSLASGLPPSLHVFLMLPDHLGSTSLVIDKATGELVEARTYQPYGATESDYRPERWKGFREDYGFTGKEEDVEVGLQYFGKRYLSPYLGRWISADPLTIHGLGGDLNLYAYVSGHVLKATDPLGLETDENGVRVGATTVHTVEVGADGEVSYTFKESSTAAKTIAAPAAWAPPNLIEGTTVDDKGALDTEAPEREAIPLAPTPDGLEEGLANVILQKVTGQDLLQMATDKPPAGWKPIRPFPNGDDTLGRVMVEGFMLGLGSAGGAASAPRLALNPKLLEYAAVRPSQALIADIGQLGPGNCFNVALAVDRRAAGAATSALRGTGVTLEEGQAALRSIYPQGSSMSFSSRGAMEKVLLSGGEGTRGIVFGAGKAEGHAFNAIVSNGRVALLDGTIGGRPGLGGYTEFNVFFTQLGGGF